MDENMDSSQAYEAVFQFLSQFWAARKKEFDSDLPVLLGSMDRTIWLDGNPGDPAYKRIWLECSGYKTQLSVDDAFEAMINMLEEYLSLGEGSERDISRTLEALQNAPNVHREIFEEIVREVTSLN